MAVISSVHNPLVKRLCGLHKPAGRREQGRFLAEGRRIIAGFLQGGWQAVACYAREGEPVPADWPAERVQRFDERVMRKVSQASTPSGLMAEFVLPASAELDSSAGGLVLVELADPGNLGTLLRSAAAFGLQQVQLCGGADPFAAKVIQASAGALARLRLARGPADDPLPAGRLIGLDAHGGIHPRDFQVDAGAARPWLLVGSEAHGLPAGVLARCDERLHLPMVRDVESLNAGVAGAIACFLVAGHHR